jgi:hypothetical protein
VAAPSYTTDLATVNLADSATGWAELSGHTSGGAASAETDFYIQNTTCISQSTGTSTGTNAGMQYDYGSNITWSTGYCVFMWQIFLAPNAIDTWANGGMRIGVGSTSGNIRYWKAMGKDFGRYPYGGWQNTAIDPTYSYDYTEGTPVAGNYRIFASWPNMTAAISKGSPHGVDAIRYGRGKLEVTAGDLANGYATFAGMASKNDANDATNGYNRWGLFQYQAGSYLWKGLMAIGSSSTAVDFRDANRNIVIEDTPRTYAAFNRIEVRNASSRVDWTAIQFSALGTLAKGEFEVIDDADVNFASCTFTDMSTFVFKANSTVSSCIFRRCGQVTVGGADITGCTFDQSTATSAVLAASPANAGAIDNTTFISDGTGYAITITGTAANITLNNVNFSGYATSDGTSGNEAIYVNIASGSMNITISGGTTPSIRTAGCTITIISGAVNVDLYVKTATGTAISGAQTLLKADAGGNLPSNVTVTIANSGTTATVTHTGHGLATNDKVLIKGASHYQNNGVFSITKTGNDTYTYTLSSAPGSNPTGTIKSTFVVLSGTTDSNGLITMSRVFPADQPVSGWARKSSASPYYKTGPVSGTVDSATGAIFTALLIADE